MECPYYLTKQTTLYRTVPNVLEKKKKMEPVTYKSSFYIFKHLFDPRVIPYFKIFPSPATISKDFIFFLLLGFDVQAPEIQ